MASRVNISRRNDPSKEYQALGTLAGAAAGSVVPGLGTLAGAAAGSQLGGIVGAADSLGRKSSDDPQAVGGSDRTEALMRRQKEMNQDNLLKLQQAEQALPNLPEDLRQQYAPAIIQARMLEEQKRKGMSNA